MVTAPSAPIETGPVNVSYRTFHLMEAVAHLQPFLLLPQLHEPKAFPPELSGLPCPERWHASSPGCKFVVRRMARLSKNILFWFRIAVHLSSRYESSLNAGVFLCPCANSAQSDVCGAGGGEGQEWTCRPALLSLPLPEVGELRMQLDRVS